MAFFDNLMNKISKGKKADEINKEIVGNVIGFYRVDSTVQTGQLILEVANLLNESGKRVCIIDTNPLSDFYTGKFSDKLTEGDSLEVPSISKRFMNSSTQLSECLIDAGDKLKLLTFGTTSYINVFKLDYNVIENTYLDVKENFDIVLVDICNLPVLETVTAAMKICSKVFSMWGVSVDSLMQHTKLVNFYNLAGLDGKLCNVILNNVPYGTTLKSTYKNLDDIDIDIILEIPEVSFSREISQNKFILDKMSSKAGVYYASCVDSLVNEILVGGACV